MYPEYHVYILNANRERITEITNLIKMDQEGNILKYAKQLSDKGFCRFRVAKNDPLFDIAGKIYTQYGNILTPYSFGVQVTRAQKVVWQGIIVNNPHRRRNYIDVEAFGYLFKLKKLLVKRDVEVTPGDGKDNYRTFNAGTMAAAVTNTFTEAQAFVPGTDIMKSFVIGTVENPDFPGYFTKVDGTPLTGAWQFSTDMTIQFDYKSLLYIYQAFGMYANTDFEITDDLVFNFKRYIGNRTPDVVFEYNAKGYGNVEDYDVPLRGERTTNDLMGIAADLEGNVLHINSRDEDSIGDNGLLQDVQAFLDVKDKNPLRSRLAEELKLISRPDSVLNLVLNQKAYPLGKWGVGDTVTARIRDGIIQTEQQRRVTAYAVTVHNTGKERIVVETNPTKEGQ